MQLNNYIKLKDELINCINEVISVTEGMNFPTQINNLRTNIENLDNEHFEILVVGEFSRGKSTFVNAMMGRKLLPSSSEPTTAIISKIVYGKKPTFTLHYKDEQTSPKQVSEKDFLKITAPREADIEDEEQRNTFIARSEELDRISYTQIAYPLEFCRNNVEVVDTPGTNDLNVGRIEITYKYLNNADAVIMMLGGDQALTKSELEFLKERILGNQIEDIFFIINNKDLLGGVEQEQRVIEFVRENLQKQLQGLPKDLPIFLVSSKQALIYRRVENGEQFKPKMLSQKPESLEETGFIEFEQALGKFLSEEKGKVKLRKYIRQVQSTIKQINSDIDLRIEAVSHSADEVRQKLDEMKPKFQKAKNDTANIINRMKDNLKVASSDIFNESRLQFKNVKDAAYSAVDGTSGTPEDIEIEVANAITIAKKNFIEVIREKESQTIRKEHEKACNALQKIWTDINTEYYEDFSSNLHLNDEDFYLDLNLSDSNDDDSFFGKAALGGGIAAFIAGAPLIAVGALGLLAAKFFGFFDDPQKELRDKVKRQIDKRYNQERKNVPENVKNHFEAQTEAVSNRLGEIIEQRINGMQNQLQIILEEKNCKEQDIAKESANLQSRKKKLIKISMQMEELVK